MKFSIFFLFSTCILASLIYLFTKLSRSKDCLVITIDEQKIYIVNIEVETIEFQYFTANLITEVTKIQ
jgi:hypothetical protein